MLSPARLCQAPLSMGLSRQEYWSGSPCPPPGGLPDPGTKPLSCLLCRQILYYQCLLENPEQGIRCKKIESQSRSDVSDSFQPHGLYSSWNSLGQNTGVGSLSLLQGIFPTQGLNLGLPHCRRILYQLSHKESKKIILPEKDSLKCLNNPKIMTASEKLVPYMRILKRWHAFKRVFIMFSPGICI